MTRNPTRHRFCLCAFLALSTFIGTIFAASTHAVTIPTVPVGNAGNAPDRLWTGANPTSLRFGAVAYDYHISTTEVTNDQYAEFLNFKAASDPLGLYNANMGSNVRGGITRSGSDGSYTYTTKTNMGNKPVNYVSWYDAIRFANWLNNGQGAGDTETGAYTILGGTATPSDGLSITRNAGAKWFLPSEDEWYKAAYHQPAAQGGDSDDYWLYPTGSNNTPTIAGANSVGDISNPGTNVVNYAQGAGWNSLNGSVTTVGSAGPLSDSYYGTADQGGNLLEWNESLYGTAYRVFRGGSFGSTVGGQSSSRGITFPTNELFDIGFRVATVPEPSTAALGIVGLALMLWWGKRRK